MSFFRKHRRKLVLTALALAALLFIHPIQNAIFTMRLLLKLGSVAGQEVSAEGLVQSVVELSDKGIRATVYKLEKRTPETAIIFIPGLTELGIEHPRFKNLAKGLASLGYLVLTPDITSFKRFRLDPKAIEEIRLWYDYLKRDSAPRALRVGIAGTSVAGTLALMVAAHPAIRDEIAFVVSVGGYSDLLRLNQYWFSETAVQEKHGRYPVYYYGRWIIMLSALEALELSRDRERMEQALRQLIITGTPPKQPPELSPEANRWYRAAVATRWEDKELLEIVQSQVASHVQDFSPEEELEQVRCPVFLVHGSHDELIPSSETVQLQKQLTAAEVHVLITPLLTHTHPRFQELSTVDKWMGYWESVGFLFAFADHQV